jgi:hypothetical protein
VFEAILRRLLLTACLCITTNAAFGQGPVNFYNSSSTLVSAYPDTPISGSVGSFYFALLTSAVGANSFTFSGL